MKTKKAEAKPPEKPKTDEQDSFYRRKLESLREQAKQGKKVTDVQRFKTKGSKAKGATAPAQEKPTTPPATSRDETKAPPSVSGGSNPPAGISAPPAKPATKPTVPAKRDHTMLIVAVVGGALLLVIVIFVLRSRAKPQLTGDPTEDSWSDEPSGDGFTAASTWQ